MSEFEIRFQALQMAMQIHRDSMSPEIVIKTAGRLIEFLANGPRPAVKPEQSNG